jgi:hypothetical protein
MTLPAQYEGAPVEVRRAPTVSPDLIRQTTQQIALLQEMVRSNLTANIDYGRIPGTPQACLWDPGASMIINSFNCRIGERRVLKFEDTNEKIAVCLEIPLVSRVTGEEVASGVGAASTFETKYKYRWVTADEAGLDQETLATFKKRERNGRTEYRVENPEHGELLNTCLKMASKRAEVDAAESLPGVSTALRHMFAGGAPQSPQGQPAQKPARNAHTDPWSYFWGEIQKLGLTQEQAHEMLGVRSIKADWVDQGRSLPEALEVLRGRPAGSPPPAPPPAQQPAASRGETFAQKYDSLFGQGDQTTAPPEQPAPSEKKPSEAPSKEQLEWGIIRTLQRSCNLDDDMIKSAFRKEHPDELKGKLRSPLSDKVPDVLTMPQLTAMRERLEKYQKSLEALPPSPTTDQAQEEQPPDEQEDVLDF